MNKDPIVEFYRGRGPDSAGRTLDEILAWDDDLLEQVHDYIQWLFPTRRHSDYNPDAPRLLDDTVRDFLYDDVLRERLLAALERMLSFFGLRVIRAGAQPEIGKSARWRDRATNWLTVNNHNHLRITRILSSLCLLGLPEYARAFHHELERIQEEYPSEISEFTLDCWRSAVRPRSGPPG